MQVAVRLFAMLREVAATDRITVETGPDLQAAGLKAAIADRYPALAAFVPACRVAVDLRFVGEDQPIPAGAEVALIPPVSGG